MKMPLLIAGTLLVSAAAIHHSQLCPLAKAMGIVKETKHVPASSAVAKATSAHAASAVVAANSVAVNSMSR